MNIGMIESKPTTEPLSLEEANYLAELAQLSVRPNDPYATPRHLLRLISTAVAYGQLVNQLGTVQLALLHELPVV